VYEDSVVKNTYGLEQTVLENAFSKYKPFLVRNDTATYSDRYNKDLAILLGLEPIELELEYQVNPEKYVKDSILLAYEDAKYKVFQNVKRKGRQVPREKMIERLKGKYRVQVLDPAYQEKKMDNPGEAFKIAQSFHNERKLDDALKQYGKIRKAFTGEQYETLQDSVCMAMAQVYVEKEKYKDALTEYRRLLFLYPKSSNNYKAQFMIGFIYAENLKKDELAIKAFKVLLEKYPKCDLADDADWMVRNIESGGALMPVLEDG
jgi:tetratricopeptide (TPR) repeat protein